MPERFPGKRQPELGFSSTTSFIQQQVEAGRSRELSQTDAVWNMYGEYPDQPHAIVYMTDIHYGSKGVDYDGLKRDVDTILNTPNMFVLMGGDLIDAFSPTKHATGMRSDAIPPEQQVEAIKDLLSMLDGASKLGAVQIGNHDHWADIAGYDFTYFLRGLQCPIFQGDGNIDIRVGTGQPYRIYWSHTHWGNSKLNITNAGKRALQFTSPHSDIALLGHTHQSSYEVFDIAGDTKGAIVGGTYKQKDGWANRWGLSSPGKPTATMLLWPDQKHFEILKTPQIAEKTVRGYINLREGQRTSYERMINGN